MMTLSIKGKLAAIGLAGALTAAAATPSMAYWRHGHWYGPAAVAGGIVAGTVAGAAALGAFKLIRRRYVRRAASPKLDEVSTDWLAYARSRSDETP